MNNTDDLIIPILEDIKNIVGGEFREVENTKYLYIGTQPKSIIVEIRPYSNSYSINGDDGVWSLWLWLDSSKGSSHRIPLNNPNAIKIITEAIQTKIDKE